MRFSSSRFAFEGAPLGLDGRTHTLPLTGRTNCHLSSGTRTCRLHTLACQIRSRREDTAGCLRGAEVAAWPKQAVACQSNRVVRATFRTGLAALRPRLRRFCRCQVRRFIIHMPAAGQLAEARVASLPMWSRTGGAAEACRCLSIESSRTRRRMNHHSPLCRFLAGSGMPDPACQIHYRVSLSSLDDAQAQLACSSAANVTFADQNGA